MKAALFKHKLPSLQCKASHLCLCLCLCLTTQASYPCDTTTGPPQPNTGFSEGQMKTVRIQPCICWPASFHAQAHPQENQLPPCSLEGWGCSLSTCSRNPPLFLPGAFCSGCKWGLSPPSKLCPQHGDDLLRGRT